jgi:hypothetical protein
MRIVAAAMAAGYSRWLLRLVDRSSLVIKLIAAIKRVIIKLLLIGGIVHPEGGMTSMENGGEELHPSPLATRGGRRLCSLSLA